MTQILRVICDRCRAEGQAGADPFAAFGALLDFDPVPRRAVRADGWDAEVQRAYIAALSLTGSDRAACRAVGRSAFGVTQLLAHEGSAGFKAAREAALAMAADERSRRLAEGVRAVAAEQAGWRPPDPPWAAAASRRSTPPPPPPAPDEAESEEEAFAWLEQLVGKYAMKVGQERTARLAGKIVAADYYLRQLTWIEVAIDLIGTGGVNVLAEFRHRDHHLIAIAETPFSRLLDEARRIKWAELGAPPRPEHPPRRYLVQHDGYATEPNEYTGGGRPGTDEEQLAAFKEQHRRDAEAQIAWEAEALEDYERRTAAAAAARDEGDDVGDDDGDDDDLEDDAQPESGGQG